MTIDSLFLSLCSISLAAIFLALVIGLNDGSPKKAAKAAFGMNKERVSRAERNRRELEALIARAERSAASRRTAE